MFILSVLEDLCLNVSQNMYHNKFICSCMSLHLNWKEFTKVISLTSEFKTTLRPETENIKRLKVLSRIYNVSLIVKIISGNELKSEIKNFLFKKIHHSRTCLQLFA